MKQYNERKYIYYFMFECNGIRIVTGIRFQTVRRKKAHTYTLFKKLNFIGQRLFA